MPTSPAERHRLVVGVREVELVGDAEGRGAVAPHQQPREVALQGVPHHEALEVLDAPAPLRDHRLLQPRGLDLGHVRDLLAQQLPLVQRSLRQRLSSRAPGLGGEARTLPLSSRTIGFMPGPSTNSNWRGPKSKVREPCSSSPQSGTIRSSSSALVMPLAAAISSIASRARCCSALNLTFSAIPLSSISAVSVPIWPSTPRPSTARACWLSPGQARISGASLTARGVTAERAERQHRPLVLRRRALGQPGLEQGPAEGVGLAPGPPGAGSPDASSRSSASASSAPSRPSPTITGGSAATSSQAGSFFFGARAAARGPRPASAPGSRARCGRARARAAARPRRRRGARAPA